METFNEETLKRVPLQMTEDELIDTSNWLEDQEMQIFWKITGCILDYWAYVWDSSLDDALYRGREISLPSQIHHNFEKN